nr:GTP cyclohydrolase FolE2 [Jeotgalibacillus aurantiacus]
MNAMLNKALPTKEERHKQFGSVDKIKGTKPTDKEKMADLQNEKKDYYFAIDQVGISNIRYPVFIESERAPVFQQTEGIFKLTTSLPDSEKGINMSRLPEALHAFYEAQKPLTFETLRELTGDIAGRMKQENAHIEVTFPWYTERKSPAMEVSGLHHTHVTLASSWQADGKRTESITMKAKVATLCPCSKEISEYSAHNQRGVVTVNLQFDSGQLPKSYKEDLLHVLESNASAALYPILKRPDEKFVTEQAFENPRFVEDLIRLIASELYETGWVRAFEITCENQESIHLHDAYAHLKVDKERQR